MTTGSTRSQSRMLETEFPILMAQSPQTRTSTSFLPPYRMSSNDRKSSYNSNNGTMSAAADWHYQSANLPVTSSNNPRPPGGVVSVGVATSLGRSGSLKKAYSESSSTEETEPLCPRNLNLNTASLRLSPQRSQNSCGSNTSDYHSDVSSRPTVIKTQERKPHSNVRSIRCAIFCFCCEQIEAIRNYSFIIFVLFCFQFLVNVHFCLLLKHSWNLMTYHDMSWLLLTYPIISWHNMTLHGISRHFMICL